MLQPDSQRFIRTEQLIGQAAIKKLAGAKIALFGLGGVGSYVLEALARAGIGSFVLVDNDRIEKTNINRQLFALESTIGRLKVDCAKDRILDINPDICLKAFPIFYNADTAIDLQEALADCSYIVDAVDTISAKLLLVEAAEKLNIPIISCMGTGNKLNPADFKLADIYSTDVCPIARIMRCELKKRGIKKLKVLYSKEKPMRVCPAAIEPCTKRDKTGNKKIPPSSISFVPAAAGLLIASELIKDLLILR